MIDGNKVSSMRARASVATAISIASISPALAYVDPGTGSMLVQMAVAGIAGAMFYFRQLRVSAVSWFRRTVLRQVPSPEAAATKATDADSHR